ncbi:MAG TPA: hypothetical protein VI612_00250 [Candidatus Nanoarchaeia archaeon]|nr:hypothetical protein [Candidatus Nanoarchaeia archaeon]
MKPSTTAKLEARLRQLITRWLPPHTVVQLYSKGRVNFLKRLVGERQEEPYVPPRNLERKLWGIPFRAPIMNAAGMFKNGEGYDFVASIGAGGYIGGTTTSNPRPGNEKNGIRTPFTPLPRSHAALNWLGLPNEGHETVSQRYKGINRVWGCPIVHSVMKSPDLNGTEALEALVKGMQLYRQMGVDVIELNESCPNTHKQDNDTQQRLQYIMENFKEGRKVPLVVKFSNDTPISQVPQIMDMLFELGFDGINFGNTSTKYATLRDSVDPHERALFDFFTGTFGGGFSGQPLKQRSLLLCYAAIQYIKQGRPSQEFHVWRTGGIETAKDIKESDEIGVSMNQWFTGFFEMFAKHGLDVYRELLK